MNFPRALLCTGLFFGLIAGELAAAPARPNLVVFLTDDHSRADSTVFGSTDVKTPNMERVARAGLTFERAFVVSPSCVPSQTALLTPVSGATR